VDLPQGGQVVPVVEEPPAPVPSAHIEAVSPVVEAVQESPPLEGRDQGPEEADAPVSAPEVEQAEPQFLEEESVQAEVPKEVQEVNPVAEPEIDADLATTLGRPKVSHETTGKLGALLAGRSMLVPGAVTGDEVEGDGLSDTSKLQNAYDQDRVMKAWADLILDLREKNKMGMAATLATGGLTFEDPVLKLVVANDIQYEELKESATELLHFIRVRVGNGKIAFEVEVGEEVAAPKFLTPKDRYQHWAADNPAVEELRIRLDLDLG